MTQLYGHKWHSQAGPTKHDNGRYTNEFLLWCRKLEGLSDSGYQRGFYQLEYLVKEAARLGDEAWPPSYAGFLGYCEQPPGAAMYKQVAPQLPISDEERKKRKEVAKRGIADLREVLGG